MFTCVIFRFKVYYVLAVGVRMHNHKFLNIILTALPLLLIPTHLINRTIVYNHMYVIKTESFAKRFKFTKVQLRGGQNAQSKMKIKI